MFSYKNNISSLQKFKLRSIYLLFTFFFLKCLLPSSFSLRQGLTIQSRLALNLRWSSCISLLIRAFMLMKEKVPTIPTLSHIETMLSSTLSCVSTSTAVIQMITYYRYSFPLTALCQVLFDWSVDSWVPMVPNFTHILKLMCVGYVEMLMLQLLAIVFLLFFPD